MTIKWFPQIKKKIKKNNRRQKHLKYKNTFQTLMKNVIFCNERKNFVLFVVEIKDNFVG